MYCSGLNATARLTAQTARREPCGHFCWSGWNRGWRCRFFVWIRMRAARTTARVGPTPIPICKMVPVEAPRRRPRGPSTKVLGYFQLPLRGALAVRAGAARRPTRAFVPEGHPIVAQRFIAGDSMDESTSRPGGTLVRFTPQPWFVVKMSGWGVDRAPVLQWATWSASAIRDCGGGTLHHKLCRFLRYPD